MGVVSEAARDPAALIADLREHLSTGDGDVGVRMEELRREIADLKLQQRRLMELLQKDEKGEIDVDIPMTQLGPLKALCDDKEASLRVLEEQQKKDEDADEAARVGSRSMVRRCRTKCTTRTLTGNGPRWPRLGCGSRRLGARCQLPSQWTQM